MEEEIMIKAILFFSVFASLLMMAGTALLAQEQSTQSQVSRNFTVFRSPT